MCFKSLCNAVRGTKLDNSLQKSSGPGAPLRRILSSCVITLHFLGLSLCPSDSQNALIFSHMLRLQMDTSEMPCSVGVLCAPIFFYGYFVLSEFQLCWEGGRDCWGVRNPHVHIGIFKMYNQQGPTVYHRELFSLLCNSLDGREVWGRMDICVCTAESPHFSLKLSQHC